MLPTQQGLTCCTQATLIMDLHAHLSEHEIIGLLGGTWDPAAKRIQVRLKLIVAITSSLQLAGKACKGPGCNRVQRPWLTHSTCSAAGLR